MNFEMVGLGREIGIGGSVYREGIIEEVEVIEIDGKNLVFGIIGLEVEGYKGVDGVLEERLEYVVGGWGIKLFGKVVSDCSGRGGIVVDENRRVEEGREEGDGMNGGMLGKG